MGKQIAGKVAEGSSPQLGRALKMLRTQRGWTLVELSTRSGLPISTLSRVENDKMSLNYEQLVRISSAMQIDIAQLFSPGASLPTAAPAKARRSIMRAGEGAAIESANYVHVFLATDLLNKRFIPIVGEIRCRSIEEFGELVRHPGEEFTYVTEGAIELHTDEYAPTRLGVGDSIYFDSGMGHAYIAAAPGPCRILSICSALTPEHVSGMRGADVQDVQKGKLAPVTAAHRQLKDARDLGR